MASNIRRGLDQADKAIYVKLENKNARFQVEPAIHCKDYQEDWCDGLNSDQFD